MAFVILSAGTMTSSKVRTVSVKAFLAIVAAAMSATMAAGVALGYYGFSGSETETKAQPEVDQPERRFVVDRLGELSGRLIRLETEALTLAERISVVQDFESRLRTRVPVAKAPAKPAPDAARTPSGGPMIPPLGAILGDEAGARAGIEGGDLSGLERDLERIDAALSAIDLATEARNLQLMAFPSRNPVPGIPRSSRFGNRVDPFNGRMAFHSGLDFPAPSGTPILASAGGRVVHAGFKSEYGRTVEIDHGNGLVTRYAHTSRVYVKVGDLVAPGQRIAAIGSTGRSTGPHLHFEILRDGAYVDPALYLVRS